MKKYLIAGVVAIMVAGSAAFAASLTVDGGTLQAGVDADLTCTNDAVVVYKTSNANIPAGHHIEEVEVTTSPACVDMYVQIALFNAANQQQVYAISPPIPASGIVVLPLVHGPTQVATIHGIQVLVKDKLYSTECPAAALTGLTFHSQAGATDAQIAAIGKWNGSALAPVPVPC